MAQYRTAASRLESKRQAGCRNNLLNRIQKILESRVNVFTAPDSSKSSSPGGDVLALTPLEALNKNHGEDLESNGEGEKEGLSLQSLLQRSREYVEKEQSLRGSMVKSPLTSESLSDKENESGSPLAEADGNVSSFLQHHSPVSPGQIKTPIFMRPKALTDPVNLDTLCPPQGLIDARPHRGRPRPVSAGDILFSYSGRPTDLGAAGKGRSPEGALPPGLERRLLEVEGAEGSRRASHSGSGGVFSMPDSGRDLVETGFRRRCHTLDSNLGPPHQSPHIDRSQERIPRFMAGVPQRTPPRRSPQAPLNTTFTLMSPNHTSLLRSNLNPDLSVSACQMLLTETGALEEMRTGKPRRDKWTNASKNLSINPNNVFQPAPALHYGGADLWTWFRDIM